FVSPARTIVLCGDDASASSLRTPTGTEIIRYAIASEEGDIASSSAGDARLVARRVSLGARESTFQVVFDDEALGDVVLRVPGRHNVLNALAAIGAGLALGARVPDMAPGLAAFHGVERRFERVGEVNGVLVIDDYAHHPTEIAA